MLVCRTGAKLLLWGAIVALGTPAGVEPAMAATGNRHAAAHKTTPKSVTAGHSRAIQSGMRKAQHSRFARNGARGAVLQCVPFARENSGIELVGNAATWWYSADGVYERGSRPEVGSVLNFRANQRSRLGHVGVVTKVIDARSIEIDHANWSAPGIGRGRISRSTAVVDVSAANDWSAVRVELGQTDNFGSIYPTFGFIYDRPDRGVMVANTDTLPPLPLDPAYRDLRPVAERTQEGYDEVAEAPDDAPRAVRHTARTRTAARALARPAPYRHMVRQVAARGSAAGPHHRH